MSPQTGTHNSRRARRTLLCMATGLFLSAMAAQPVFAQNATGAVVGRAEAGSQVTINNPATGFTRTVTASADGGYRLSLLPPGDYSVQGASGEAVPVTVTLGNATTVNLGGDGATTLGAVRVVGARGVTPVDVTSTETATNINREQLSRLPVERDPLSVALLAPGLVKGEFGGVSFGGSSVAENAVYINGLNVTDFYNRIGFSSVPFSFYQEFQVKTGGYSVEFGRTTGGVINAVTRSGTNEFKFGAEAVIEPFFKADGRDYYNDDGDARLISSYDDYDSRSLNVWASGPLVKDRLFFFAMYEGRDFRPESTNDEGGNFNKGKSDNGFYGGKLDWQINDRNSLSLLAFSDKDDTDTDIYDFDLDAGKKGDYQSTRFTESGGRNWALTYTGNLTDNFSMKALYGKNERNSSGFSNNDVDCSRIRDLRAVGDGDIGCTISSTVIERTDDREAGRLDFEWTLGDHFLRFGLDREVNTSQHSQFYPGPDRLLYEIRDAQAGSTLENGGRVPAGANAYVRTRTNEVDGTFESVNSAYYLEDNWSVTDNLLLNIGVRMEAFDNKDSDGKSYIKIDDMLAPRLGFSWDVNGDQRTKIFGNVGRYFLPVANVINIKQAGGFLDQRNFYVFNGLEDFDYNGVTYQRPILGDQIGGTYSQGDGTVGDLRGEVDQDIDPVYQDEFILGFQALITDKWSWGIRGTYRKLHNAIDDMLITSTGVICDGEPVSAGYVVANPGEDVTLYTDTDCDGANDGYVTVDTSKAGYAVYEDYYTGEIDDDGNRVTDSRYIGDIGYAHPKRSTRSLEFVVDRAWDEKWMLNASYTLSWNKGNAEGPVNSDTDFSDTGRTENFDDPFVNFGRTGYLPNDRRHQFKMRGTYAFNDAWQLGATLTAQSGRPVSAFGVGNPVDGTNYHSNYICVANCTAELPSDREYAFYRRGSAGRLDWTYDLGASLTYLHSFGERADLRVKLAVYNLLNERRTIEVDDEYESEIGFANPEYRQPTGFQSPRYGQLTVSLDF